MVQELGSETLQHLEIKKMKRTQQVWGGQGREGESGFTWEPSEDVSVKCEMNESTSHVRHCCDASKSYPDGMGMQR